MHTIKIVDPFHGINMNLVEINCRKKEVSINFLLKNANVKIFLIKSVMHTLDSVDNCMPHVLVCIVDSMCVELLI